MYKASYAIWAIKKQIVVDLRDAWNIYFVMGLIDDVVYGTKVLKDDIVNINTPHLVQSLAKQYNSKSLQLHNLSWYQRH